MTKYATGGYVNPSNSGGWTWVRIHPGEYLYRASDGTFWHVQQHPDGDIRTPVNVEDDKWPA